MNLLSFQQRFPDPTYKDLEPLLSYGHALEDIADYISRNKFDVVTDKRLDAQRLADTLKETIKELIEKIDTIQRNEKKNLQDCAANLVSNIVDQLLKNSNTTASSKRDASPE